MQINDMRRSEWSNSIVELWRNANYVSDMHSTILNNFHGLYYDAYDNSNSHFQMQLTEVLKNKTEACSFGS